MATERDAGWDGLAALVAAVAALVGVWYLVLISRQDGHLAGWFLAGLGGAAGLAAYGAARAAPRRGAALLVSGAALIVLGMLAIFSIGLPLLVAGGLALAAAIRSRRGSAG